LPLVSSGGTAIWMTCFAIGVILSVTKKESEIQQEELDKQERSDREQEELARLYLERQQKEMENEVL
jgi:cell division protein FtsW